jgi:hypothetical protein
LTAYSTSVTVTATGGDYVTVSTQGCQWTGTGACPYSWGNCRCGQGIYETRSNPRPNIQIDPLAWVPNEFDGSKKKTHHAHLIQRHIRSRRPDRATRFKSKSHVWSTPTGAPRKYL